MMKFFRRIRQNLLSEGNEGKYLRYAFGEILLVVVGILIALSINNWNEARKRREAVQVYLKNFVEDLNDDKKRMELLEGHNSFRYHSLQHLLKMSGEAQFETKDAHYVVHPLSDYNPWKSTFPDEFNKEFVYIAMEVSQQSFSYDVNQSTIAELNSTGLFSTIENDALKAAINNYYEVWQWRMGENQESYNWELIEKWEDALAVDGITTSDPFATDNSLSFLKDDPTRLAILKRLIREAGWTAQSAALIKEKANDLIRLVQEEIDRDAE